MMLVMRVALEVAALVAAYRFLNKPLRLLWLAYRLNRRGCSVKKLSRDERKEIYAKPKLREEWVRVGAYSDHWLVVTESLDRNGFLCSCLTLPWFGSLQAGDPDEALRWMAYALNTACRIDPEWLV